MTTPPSDDNPFRTPSYPAAPPPMPSMPQAPGPQPIPHWFTTKVRITLVACVVVALGLGSLAALGLARIGPATTPSNGDCLYLARESGDRIAYHSVSCGLNSATYKVENSYRGTIACSSNGYVRFRTTSVSGTDRTLCLALNVRTGDCLRNIEDEVAVAKVSCSDPAATERVEVVSASEVEGERCKNADDTRVYSGPPARVVCLVPPGENI